MEIGTVKSMAKQFREKRTLIKELEKYIKIEQKELISALRTVDPKNQGVVFAVDDKGTVYRNEPESSEVWDFEAVARYLARRPLLRKACTSTVIDPNKLEACAKAGDIPKEEIAKMKIKPDDPAPYVRFGAAHDDSIREEE